jgi:hypothetical protein
MKKQALVGFLILFAVGCTEWPWIPGFPSGAGGWIGTTGSGGGSAGASGSGGEGTGGAGGAGPCAGASCECGGFVMPNPASSGLPNPAMYDLTIPGIVTDTVTGLQWERADGGRTPTEGCTASNTIRCASRSAVENFCASLRLGGFEDWRVPSPIELVSLIDFTASPAVAPGVFLDPPSSNPYWTTTAWEVSLSLGITVDSDVPVAPPVRCVRRAAPSRCWPAGARYQAATGNQVTDQATGLIWEQTVISPPVIWEGAQTHCASLGSGFRAPTVKELQTIAIFEGGSRIDTVAFPDTPLAHYWTSHLRLSDPTWGWSVKFNTGGGGGEGRYFAGSNDQTTTLLPVRCVR